MVIFSSGVKCFRSFLIRSLRYLNGRTLSPFPTEAGQREPGLIRVLGVQLARLRSKAKQTLPEVVISFSEAPTPKMLTAWRFDKVGSLAKQCVSGDPMRMPR